LREHLRQQSPWDRANLRELALLHLKSRQIGQATQILRQLAHDDPSDLATAVLLARTLHEQSLRTEARDLLVAAAAACTNPGSDPESLEVADMLAELGADEAAQALLAKASEGQGDIATAATIRLGNLLYHADQWEKAADVYASLPEARTRTDLLRREVECRIRAGALAAAKTLLDELQRLEPDHPLSHVLAAELALANGNLAWARSACAQALVLDPGCALAFLMRARIALREDSGSAAVDRAVKDLRKACLRDPKLTDARELLVRLLLEQGQPDEAAATLGLLIGARPNDHRLKLALARLLLEIGQRNTLDSALRRWQQESPGEPFWSHIEGMLAMQQNDPLKAANAYRRHFARTGDAASLLAATDGYLAASLPAEAEQLCRELPPGVAAQPEAMVAKARVLATSDPKQARGLVAQALRGVQDQARAEGLLRQARKAIPPVELAALLEELRAASPSRTTALALAETWEALGKADHAANLLRALAEEATGADRAELLARLAAAEYAAGRAAEAEAGLREALALAPNDPALLNNAAHLALAIGNRDAEAVRLAKRAVAASAEDRELHACALATLGEGLFRLRLLDQARDALLKALAIHDNPEDRLLLGRALLADGQALKGAAQLRRAKEQAEQDGKSELAKKIAALL
jgi:tetratricopeptide (TPR) repeat protein